MTNIARDVCFIPSDDLFPPVLHNPDTRAAPGLDLLDKLELLDCEMLLGWVLDDDDDDEFLITFLLRPTLGAPLILPVDCFNTGDDALPGD